MPRYNNTHIMTRFNERVEINRDEFNLKRTLRRDTDENLYSYTTLIGTYEPDYYGTIKRVVYDHTAKGGHFISRTTSKHIGILKRSGQHTLVNPYYDSLAEMQEEEELKPYLFKNRNNYILIPDLLLIVLKYL